MKKVTIVKEDLPGFTGMANLYKTEDGTHVVASATYALFTGPETMVFRADENGDVTDWSSLGSVREIDHESALEDAGFELCAR